MKKNMKNILKGSANIWTSCIGLGLGTGFISGGAALIKDKETRKAGLLATAFGLVTAVASGVSLYAGQDQLSDGIIGIACHEDEDDYVETKNFEGMSHFDK